MRKSLLGAMLGATVFIPQAQADHYRATIDPQVYYAGEEVFSIMSFVCNSGMRQLCNVLPQVRQELNNHYHLSYACKAEGNAAACTKYQQESQNLFQLQQQLRTKMAAGAAATPGATPGVTPGPAAGTTHQERMQQIQQWGAMMKQRGADSMKTLESMQKGALDMIRR